MPKHTCAHCHRCHRCPRRNQSVLLSSSSSVSPPRPVPTTMAPRFLVCRPSAGARGCLSVLVQNTQSLISATSNRSWPRQMRLPSESLCSPYYIQVFFFVSSVRAKESNSLPLCPSISLPRLPLCLSQRFPQYFRYAETKRNAQRDDAILSAP